MNVVVVVVVVITIVNIIITSLPSAATAAAAAAPAPLPPLPPSSSHKVTKNSVVSFPYQLLVDLKLFMNPITSGVSRRLKKTTETSLSFQAEFANSCTSSSPSLLPCCSATTSPAITWFPGFEPGRRFCFFCLNTSSECQRFRSSICEAYCNSP
ncbi:hypothetical protein PoB_002064000 [Plakobranchus ocellatus]|uniref:Secreted protein n=1 Tax=Plakobranchus ocellatus TaxID=259542 RepID=A0AAV3ZHS3_9GAST|nr:hypothetical protein PoB_002064000 [Plakobranchus ocellatus]